MGTCHQPTDLKYIKEGRRYIKNSHTVHFTQYKVHHWNEIENPILVIWLMSGMIVFDPHIEGIDGTEIARCHSTFPRSTFSTKRSAPLKWHRKSAPSSMAVMPYHTVHTQWGQIWCDQWNFPSSTMSWSQGRCAAGKILLIPSQVLPFCISWLYPIHGLYFQDQIFDAISMVHSILPYKYCVGTYCAILLFLSY